MDEKKELEGFEVQELEDQDLEDAAGGAESNGNCPNCSGCGCPCEPDEPVKKLA